jgi:multiple sugar transport system permease protein
VGRRQMEAALAVKINARISLENNMTTIVTTYKRTPVKTKKITNQMERRQVRFALLMIAPAMVMILLFIGYPIVQSFLLTFSDFTIHKTDWFAAGFENYEKVLDDKAFKSSLSFTLYYTLFYVPLSVLLGLLISVLLQQVKYGVSFFRSILFLPTVIPITMGLLMFQWVLDPNNGILNHILSDITGQPIKEMPRWFDLKHVFESLVVITLWGFGPWILMLAGILSIPRDFYDAAKVDGANPLQEFLYITLPQLRSTILVVTTLQTIKALKLFVPIYMLTNGNPAGRTRSLYFLVFERVNRGANWYTYA